MKRIAKVLTVLVLIAFLGVCDAGWMQERFILPDPGEDFVRLTDINGFWPNGGTSPDNQDIKVFFDEGTADSCYLLFGTEQESEYALGYWNGSGFSVLDTSAVATGLPKGMDIVPLGTPLYFAKFNPEGGGNLDYNEYYLDASLTTVIDPVVGADIDESATISAGAPIIKTYWNMLSGGSTDFYWLYDTTTNFIDVYSLAATGVPPAEPLAGIFASYVSTTSMNAELDTYLSGSGIWTGDFELLGYGHNPVSRISFYVVQRKDAISDEEVTLIFTWDEFTLTPFEIEEGQKYCGFFLHEGVGYVILSEQLDYPAQKYILHVFNENGEEVNTVDAWGRNLRFMGNGFVGGEDVLLFQLQGDVPFGFINDSSFNVSVFYLPKSTAAGG